MDCLRPISKVEGGSPPLLSLRTAELSSEDNEFISITDAAYVASYNIIEGQERSILVPGIPPRWVANRDRMQKLNKDVGLFFQDDNAARFGKYPSEPLVRALFHMVPAIQTRDIDVVACGNTLGALLDFARSKASDTRFLAQMIGSTLFIVRDVQPHDAAIENVRGYGHSFLDANTQWDPEVVGSVSHQRVVRYEFGGLHYLVRAESDGYLPEKVEPRTSSTPKTVDRSELLEEIMGKFGVGSSQPISSVTSQKGLQVDLKMESSNSSISQGAIFDLKTRSSYGDARIDMAQILPRLWVAQIPNFIVAYHRGGRFYERDIHITDKRTAINTWQTQNSEALSKLKTLMSRLIQAATTLSKSSKIEITIRSQDEGRLDIKEVQDPEWEALPPALSQRWSSLQSALAP